jgi:hypothetical protein
METVKARSCLSVRTISSSNSPPQILSPPVPSPFGSPHCTYIHHISTKRCIPSTLCRTVSHHESADDSVKDGVVEIEGTSVCTEVLHCARTLGGEELRENSEVKCNHGIRFEAIDTLMVISP